MTYSFVAMPDGLLISVSSLLVYVSSLLISVSGLLIQLSFMRAHAYMLAKEKNTCPFCPFCQRLMLQCYTRQSLSLAEGAEGTRKKTIAYIYARA